MSCNTGAVPSGAVCAAPSEKLTVTVPSAALPRESCALLTVSEKAVPAVAVVGPESVKLAIDAGLTSIGLEVV